MEMVLTTTPRTTSLGLWVPTRDGGFRCGNVKVAPVTINDGRANPTTWRIYVRDKWGIWQLLVLKQRPWGYGHAGQAKIGAALAARHRRPKV